MPSVRNVRATTFPSGVPTEASSPAATSPPATTPGGRRTWCRIQRNIIRYDSEGHPMPTAELPVRTIGRSVRSSGRLLPWSFPRASGSPCRCRSSLPIGVDPSEGAGRRTCPRQPRSGGGGPCDNRGIHLRRFPGPKRYTPPRACGNGPKPLRPLAGHPAHRGTPPGRR